MGVAMLFRSLAITLSVSCGCSALLAQESTAKETAKQATRPPNIIFILADALGRPELGCHGPECYQPPHIDRLARQGLRFSCWYNCQSCTPTRVAIMSGQHPARTGVFTVGSLERGLASERKMIVPHNETNLPLDRKTIADMLQA